MPCSDVTERIEIVLDGEDRLKEYEFSKRTCGQGVGMASLLIEQLRGRSLDELLHITGEEFLEEFPFEDEVEEFLSLKHLFAVQGALEVLTGVEPGAKDSAFAASRIEYGENETRIAGLIAVDVVTEKIESCGGCKGCGTKRSQRAAKPSRRSKVESAVG